MALLCRFLSLESRCVDASVLYGVWCTAIGERTQKTTKELSADWLKMLSSIFLLYRSFVCDEWDSLCLTPCVLLTVSRTSAATPIITCQLLMSVATRQPVASRENNHLSNSQHRRATTTSSWLGRSVSGVPQLSMLGRQARPILTSRCNTISKRWLKVSRLCQASYDWNY